MATESSGLPVFHSDEEFTMKTFVAIKKCYLFILVALLAAFGMQGTSQAQGGNPTLTASVENLSDLKPMTEEMLDGSLIILTLSGGTFVEIPEELMEPYWGWVDEDAPILTDLTLSGIEGVYLRTQYRVKTIMSRVNDTKVTFPIGFQGNLNTDKSLVITVGPEAIVDYDGPPLTAEIPVFAVKESLEASPASPLTEINLHGNVVTLTLHGRTFRSAQTILDALDVSGVGTVSVNVERVSDTKANITFNFKDDFDTDATLALTVRGDAFAYNKSFTFEFPVTAEVETEALTLTVSTPKPLTEATLNGSEVTLTLGGAPGSFGGLSRSGVEVSGIEGIWVWVEKMTKINSGEIAVSLGFFGAMDADGTLTFSISTDDIIGYKGPPLSEVTAQIPVKDSLISGTGGNSPLTLTVSSDKPLTEATLPYTNITLTLEGAPGVFNSSPGWLVIISRAPQGLLKQELMEVSGIEGIRFVPPSKRWSLPTINSVDIVDMENMGGDTSFLDLEDWFSSGHRQFKFRLRHNQRSIDADTIVTFTIPMGLISGYEGPELTELTAEIVVKKSAMTDSEYLWMVVPTHDASETGISAEIDSLALSSNAVVSESDIALTGVTQDDTLGNLSWTSGKIQPGKVCPPGETTCSLGLLGGLLGGGGCSQICYSNNLNNTLSGIGLVSGENTIGHTAYAFTYINSAINQRGEIYLRSSDAVKVWLNGEIVYTQSTNTFAPEYASQRHSFPVTLKTGSNPLLVKIRQSEKYWDLNIDGLDTVGLIPTTSTFKIAAEETELTPTTAEGTIVEIKPLSSASTAVGEKMEVNLNIIGGKGVAGYQATVRFDTTVLGYVSSVNGDYLPAGAFFVEPKLEGDLIKLSAASVAGESSGDGRLATLTFEVIAVKTSTLTLSDVLLTNKAGETFAPQVENAEITEPAGRKEDVNGDSIVNIADLVLVASSLGKTGQNAADVNGDGQVNIADLVLVAGALGTATAAPSLLHPDTLETLTSADVRQWLSQAQHLSPTDAMSRRGVVFLEQLLVVLTPKETALLANYPNPFNPETWIPYQLSKAADVTLTIYAVNGQVVRRLALGHQAAGIYQNRSRAAYWNGRNAVGEPVASGLYFYTLTAGDFTATRKMLIRK